MEKKINHELIVMGIVTVILTWLIISFTYYQAFEKNIQSDLKITTDKIAATYLKDGNTKNLSDYELGKYRVTIIDSKGKVLYDNKAKGELENHLERPEFKHAIKYGSGIDVRKSETLNVKAYYYAKKLENGNLIRASLYSKSLFYNFESIFASSLIILLLVLFISILVSKSLTRSIMKPIYKMGNNFDNINENIPYKEFKPFANAVKEYQLKKKENEKIRRDFTANVSHELKTPLTSISGYAEIIENGLAKEEDIKDFAGKIHSESGRLLNLIRDIIKLSELDEPTKQEYKFEQVDIYKIANEIVNLLEFNANQNEVSVQLNGENPFYVLGDEASLNELIYNLCDNAIKYNKKGGSVDISLFEANGKKVFKVKDTGIGIKSSQHERVFERFYRVDKSRSKETGGTGLGLAIVKHVAIQHGARINIFSKIDKGTEINVEFNA